MRAQAHGVPAVYTTGPELCRSETLTFLGLNNAQVCDLPMDLPAGQPSGAEGSADGDIVTTENQSVNSTTSHQL